MYLGFKYVEDGMEEIEHLLADVRGLEVEREQPQTQVYILPVHQPGLYTASSNHSYRHILAVVVTVKGIE